MGFFEVPPLVELDRGARIHELVYPSLPQPGHEFGTVIALNRLLFRTEDIAAMLPAVTVFANGFAFELWLKSRQETDRMPSVGYPASYMLRKQLDEHGQLSPQLLRFGWLFADGRRVTNLDPVPTLPTSERFVFVSRGGSSGGGSAQFRFFITPLPPPGPMQFVIEWPEHGVAETHIEFATDEMLRAAANAEPLWPPTVGDLGPAEPDEREAVLLAAVTQALGPAMISRSGIQVRGVRLQGHYPNTEVAVEYQTVGLADEQQRSFPVWRGAHDLAIKRPPEIANDIAAQILP